MKTVASKGVWHRRAVLGTGLAIVACLSVTHVAFPQNSRLRAQKSGIRAQMEQARQEKQEAVAEAAETRKTLRESQMRLKTAQDQVKACRKAIRDAELRIQESSMAVDQAEASLKEMEQLLDSRLVAICRTSPGSYVDVVLGARDFTDLTTNAYLCDRILEGDVALLDQIKEAKRAAELERERRREEEARKRREEGRLAEAQRRIAVETASCEKLLAEQNADIAECEQKLDELEAQSKQIEAMLRSLTSRPNMQPPQAWTGSMGRPTGGHITSGFGMRVHPITHKPRMHTGVDIGGSTGDPIHAAGSGVVVSTGWQGGYGNTIMINHGNGRSTLYAHLSSIGVSVGQTVTTGQLIGKKGSTGFSTGPHLHFEVRMNGTPVNPL